ncbi:methyltransferase domain-containing protein [Chlorobium phaeovibrioides]|uniref:Methyltransferase domain-containing protein n=2 Tax=Chlorobium phaeovibrioides TaxID=1094 RepID=A0A432ATY3_CHLPH|nr:methyltransferase domain-containing protein [Chlorobium phaeovibrioides]MWV53504.1 hypothetical protein [Chlorobium phaeovibrioides]RTY36235.1 methyltransferase domain-containing protein [Chlorobium phaeovibrioides]RTY36298.1 methyltransferase domain-containing protein [Chlorobium phaeovibrioides]HCD36560.1 methyltransferase domain-containing protein [Chlorobium sp.]
MSGYRNAVDGDYLNEAAHPLRWQKSIAFMADSGISGRSIDKGLDLGERTPLTGMIEELFGCCFVNSTVDLDVESLQGSYSVVCAMEVLEHLYNPLHLLLEVRRVLSGPEARLFVSMPLSRPAMLRSPDHFHEMGESEARALFGRAGFRVQRSAEFRIRRPLFYLSGVKPFLRLLFEKVQIYELRVDRGGENAGG